MQVTTAYMEKISPYEEILQKQWQETGLNTEEHEMIMKKCQLPWKQTDQLYRSGSDPVGGHLRKTCRKTGSHDAFRP